MTTIRDIANRLGVAVSTVSKGLNGANDISEDLRKLILDTAIEMGYKKKSLQKEGQKKLALFVENMDFEQEDDFGFGIVLGFKQMAFRNNIAVDVIPLHSALMAKEKYDTYMLRGGYSGAMMLGLALQDSWIQELAKTSIPTVLLDNYIKGNPNVCYIGTDNNEAIMDAITYLVNHGHKKIAFLNGSMNSLVSEERMAAFKAGMAANDLKVNPELTVYGYFVADCAKYHVPGFLEKGATAIMCGNDLIAQGVYEEVKKAGLRIPEDISVIGFDDIPVAATMNPPLTTVRQDRQAIGRVAYFALDSLINQVSVSRAMLRACLMERDSVGEAKERVVPTDKTKK